MPELRPPAVSAAVRFALGAVGARQLESAPRSSFYDAPAEIPERPGTLIRSQDATFYIDPWKLIRAPALGIPDVVKPYFRDVLDHVVRVGDTIDTLREMVSAAMSVNLSLVTVAQGEIVKKLAGWAGLLAAPTLIASWYGMNFEHMPELHGKHSYAILIGAVILFCVLLYRYLRKVRWL